MCAGAAWAARIGRLVWGAPNPDAGSVGSLYNLGSDPRLNHEYPATGGIRSEESADLLTAFFARHR
jgi:tRNA(adenine34) deaminase